MVMPFLSPGTVKLPGFKSNPNEYSTALAYLSGVHTMAAIAEHFGVHYTTVSRLVKAYEDA
jgi:transposase